MRSRRITMSVASTQIVSRSKTIDADVVGRSTRRPPTLPTRRPSRSEIWLSNVRKLRVVPTDGVVAAAQLMDPSHVARQPLGEARELPDQRRHDEPERRADDQDSQRLDERDRQAATHPAAFQDGGRTRQRRREQDRDEDQQEDGSKLEEQPYAHHRSERQDQGKCERLRAIERALGLGRACSLVRDRIR